VSSESDFVLARPMIEAEPLTMLLNMCKHLSSTEKIRICLYDVDKSSFISMSRRDAFVDCIFVLATLRVRIGVK
jgi:hypothetical protein